MMMMKMSVKKDLGWNKFERKGRAVGMGRGKKGKRVAAQERQDLFRGEGEREREKKESGESPVPG